MLKPSINGNKANSSLYNEINDLINIVLGDLKAFKSEGYPIYQGQVKKANTGDFDGLKSLLEIAHQMIDDLDEFKSVKKGEVLMGKNLYLLKVKGVKTKEEMEGILFEINCCEFCNNDSFKLSLLQFERKGSVGVALVEINTQDDQKDVKEIMYEMLNCEFCHPDMSYQTVE